MNANLKAKWTTALRSGEYEQGQEHLHTVGGGANAANDRFCCLGVLMEIAGWHNGDESFSADGQTLTDFALIEAGLPRTTHNKLTRMNDGRGVWASHPQTFSQIADWIDANL